MKSFTSISLSISCLVSIAACGGGGGGDATNPKTLWLAPDASELQVKLQSTEPQPY